jgi:citronellol/citronellal dehydrogenase
MPSFIRTDVEESTMGQLDGKVAIVTGASRGIGAQIAQRFGEAGAAVAVAARTVSEGSSQFAGTVTETVAAITAAGGTAIGVGVDLSKPAERERLVAETVEQLGPVDILVNNAAVTFYEPIGTFPAKRMALMFAVQVEGPMHLAQLVLPSMRARQSGWILNISSRAALALCTGPATLADGSPGLTGRITYSQDLLAELGITAP